MTEPRTPIALVTGSLGSGKTTLLRRVLEAADRRYAVLMNEFGEIAIDSRVIQGKNVDIVELAGGCVCCSLTGEFEAAVSEIIDRFRPDSIILEATGVAEADALVYEVEDRIPRVRLDGVVHVVDADMTVRFPAIGYAARSQLAAADIVLVNKADLVSEEQLEGVVARVREYNPQAAIIRTVRCDVDPVVLFGLGPRARKPSAPPAPARVRYESITFSSGRRFDEDRFREAVAALPPSVVRAKGFVCFADGSCLFNYVAGRCDFEDFPAESTELVFIGPSVEKDREAILRRLRECEA